MFKASVTVCKKIEKYWRDFLWKGNFDDQNPLVGNKKKLHPIRWSIVTAAKNKGGLGLTPIANTNFALMCKWLWRYNTEHFAL